MNKQEKKILAEYATKSDLEAMLRVARKEIKNCQSGGNTQNEIFF